MDEERASIPPPSSDQFATVVAERTRELEGALRQNQQLLEGERKSRQDLESVNTAKDKSLAIISRELRAPVEAILGWTKLLANGDLSSNARERGIAVIERNALAQARLIETLIDISRVAAKKMPIFPTTVDLADVVEGVVDAFKPEAERKGVTVATDLGRRVPVNGDPPRLEQIASHLLGNAIRSTSVGGRIHIRVAQREDLGCLSISDTGRGISAEQVPHIFDCFREREEGSTDGLAGLGLFLVCKLVELHDGNVWAESEGRGKGSRFTVALPMAKNGSRKKS